MNIIYNGTDITASVQPLVLNLKDNAGGKPDSLTAIFSDTDGLWTRWKPAKNDTIQVRHGGYDTGVMFVDYLAQTPGRFHIKALSIPQKAKTARSQAWENVRLHVLALEIAKRYGFKMMVFGAENHLYKRIDQIEQADFAFLADLCTREGYAVKINDRTLVLYSEEAEESREIDPQKATIYAYEMIGDYEFENKSVDIYGKCIVRSQAGGKYIQAEYADPAVEGPTLTMNLHASDLAEAQRWARGILRSFNKRMITGSFSIALRPGLAAGSCIYVRNVGIFDGKYFVHQLIHDLISGKTHLTVRRPLEGC